MRHHLKELEVEGLVRYDRSRRGVGAPAVSYRLSPGGEALFPRRYQETLTALLDQIVEREGREAAVALLDSHLAQLAARLKADLAGLAAEERLAAVARLRTEQGYMADVSESAVLTGGVVFYQSGDLPEFEKIGDNDRVFAEVAYHF